MTEKPSYGKLNGLVEITMEQKFMALENTQDLRNLGQLDTASETPLFYGETLSPLDTHKGIINDNTKEFVNVVSKHYRIIQHTDVIPAIADALDQKGVTVKGNFYNSGNVIRGDLLFTDNGTPIKDDAQGLQVGFRFTNSYNKQTAFRLELFAYRMVCSNGMALGNALNGIKEVMIHTGKEKTYESIFEAVNLFIDRAIDSVSALQKLVDASIKDQADWDRVTGLLEKYVKEKKHRNKIFEQLGIASIEIKEEGKPKRFEYVLDNKELAKMTRWELYNAITNVATHTEISVNVEDKLQRVAQKILVGDFETMIPPITVEN